jgi:ADP-heptose:LPS heptosyltransferase
MKKNENEKLASLRVKLMQFKILNIFKYIFYYLDKFIMLFIKKPTKKGNKTKILIIANLGLGDAINFLSVADKYRNLYPKKKYEITLLTQKGLDKIFKEESDFDNIITYNTNMGVFNMSKRIELFKIVNKEKYDILIDPMGATGASMNVYISNICNATKKITIVNKATSICPKFLLKRAYTDVYYIEDKKITNIEYYNQLVDFLNNGKSTPIKFHKTKNYEISVKIPNEYYIVFPSASANVKKWNLEKYAQIIKKIYNKTKLPVLFCGTSIDKESVNELISLIDVPYYNIIGKTNMLEFIQVIKQAKFVITNDTSSYHIAVNEEIPVAIIVGGYTFDGYVTYNFKNNNYKKPYVITDKRDCFNCFSNCPYLKKGAEKYPCLESVTVDYAWNIIEKMIDEIKE